ncbi:uncharacterized protein LOC135131754 [Zophobas morio]|uniref:uncharacterized protein LOC135131754 n=1 Tax=Zophobas morio TaxID=2755281 RepID=UPI0030837251
MPTVEELKETRKQTKSAVTRFESFLDKFEANNINYLLLEERLINYKPLLKQFEEVQSKIEILRQSDEEADVREAFEDRYYELLVRARKIIELKTKPGARTPETEAPNQTQNSSNIAVQLPIINLPKFSGEYTEWTTFYDSFISLIHENSSLSNIQKFHYLKGCLLGDAKRTIDLLPISAESYQSAWNLLTDRYKNKRLIVQNHIHAIFNLQPMNKSPSSLRELLDGISTHLAALTTQNVDVTSWDVLLIYLTTTKFDFLTKREWESRLKANELPTWKQMVEFLKQRCLTLESMEFNLSNHNVNSAPLKKTQNAEVPVRKNYQFVNNQNTIACVMCKGHHNLFHCPKFLELSINERIEHVKRWKICFNCLKGGHDSRTCRSMTCKICSNRHNSLLHQSRGPNYNNQSQTANLSINNYQLNSNVQVILSTALVQCSDSNGKVYTCRALLDQGSQQHLITEEMCKRLNLTTKSVHAGISSVCGSYNEIKHSTTLHFKSLHDNYTEKIACLVVPNINRNYPIDTFDKSEIPVPQNLNLADPNYNISSPIDILIGAALFWELLRDGRMKLSNEQTFLHNTCLGWILGGPFTAAAIQINSIFCGNLNTCALEHLDKQVTKFWEVENYDNRIENLSSEDQLCENLFVKQHSRDPNGKFIVRLPFKANPPNLGSTKEIAYKRFRSLEKKFENNYEFRNQYCTFMADYIALNHMQLATDQNIHEGCFLPHHGVIKDSSLTTKVRAVFDASTKSSSGFSLNDYLLPGQNLQTDIFSLLVRSRQYQFVLSADIVKMFRQIWVAPDDWKYQKVLWRSNLDEPIRIYCLKTVSYGMACAPYLAMRCLRQLAVETADSYPHASRVILEDFYMDDLLTGTNDETEAITLRDNLINILGSGGFEITKWASNNDALLPQCHSDNTALVRLDENMQTKTLGLSWDCANDNLKYDFKLQHPIKITKRSVLSTIATVYDPIGILGPVLVSAKLILQKLWQLQSDWDDELPPELSKQFEHFLAELQHVNEIQIPRKVVADYPYQKIQIHGFSDASTKAYGAAVYIRTTDISNSHTVKLLCSKTRVAPIKQITLPRLELCAATLLAKLMSKVKNAMKINFDDCYLWSDSTIALSWIAASPNRWQTFVANRVSEIQTLTNNCKWRHVISNENPADIISRGMDPIWKFAKERESTTYLNHNCWIFAKYRSRNVVTTSTSHRLCGITRVTSPSTMKRPSRLPLVMVTLVPKTHQTHLFSPQQKFPVRLGNPPYTTAGIDAVIIMRIVRECELKVRLMKSKFPGKALDVTAGVAYAEICESWGLITSWWFGGVF